MSTVPWPAFRGWVVVCSCCVVTSETATFPLSTRLSVWNRVSALAPQVLGGSWCAVLNSAALGDSGRQCLVTRRLSLWTDS